MPVKISSHAHAESTDTVGVDLFHICVDVYRSNGLCGWIIASPAARVWILYSLLRGYDYEMLCDFGGICCNFQKELSSLRCQNQSVSLTCRVMGRCSEDGLV